MKPYIYILLALLMCACAGKADAQTTQNKRYITPVEVNTNRTLLPRKGEKLKYIERDSLTLDSLRRDSIAKIYPHYPIITDITLGAGVGDAVGRLFGQKYSSFDISASVNMWNRLSPVIELGVGWANSTPEELNYTYKGKLAPYAKIGANYNFMFKSHPDYQFFAGLRVGYSTFKYDITNISISNGYWGEDQAIDLLNQKSHAMWGEFSLGLRVKLWQSISAGWTLKYHNVFSYKKNPNGDPWFIPGFGSRTSKLAVGFSVYYTLPTSKKKWPKIDENGKLLDINKPYGDDSDSTAVSTPELPNPSDMSGTSEKAEKANSSDTPTEKPEPLKKSGNDVQTTEKGSAVISKELQQAVQEKE
ncbi:MAG: DUF6048 family protein [Muribaculaceae bacterium]